MFVPAQWTSITSPFTGSLYSVAFGSQNVGCIGGANNNVLLTTDGGNTWTIAPGTTFPAVDYSLGNDIWFTDTNTIYIGSNAGKLIKSINQGQSLVNSNPALPYGFAIHALSFPTSNFGYTAGVFGEMSKTTNAGASWTNISISTSNDLDDVYFFSTSTGVVIGDNGFIRRTTTGGLTWSAVSSGTTNKLNKMHFINSATGFAVGNSGTILKTTTGGASWSAVTSPVTANLNGICFKNSLEGFIVGSSGTILKTINGGTTWQVDNSGTTNTLNDIKYTGSRFIIVGYSGTILTQGVTGITENTSTLSVSIFPDPTADGHVTITGIEPGMIGTLQVYDLSGKEVMSTISAAQFSGTLELPRRGVYLVAITTASERIVKRVIW